MKKIGKIIGGVILLTVLSSCNVSLIGENKDKEEIEQSFEKVLEIYPTENLMDFYDMEGFRDSEFEEDDKGVWVLDSSMSIKINEDTSLVSEGMLLRMNRNTRTAKGFYYIYETKTPERKQTKYPVTYDEQGIHLVEEVADTVLKEKIENFQFFVQYGNFKNLSEYENLRKMYNPEVPMYELEYQLTNEDPNVKQLRERYEIPTNEAPTLVLNGTGDLDGSSVGYKNITFQFTKKPPVFFSDSIDYQISNEEDNK